ncbi:MAG: hypothetical protein HC768_07855 [Acaryochloris sp. CRU_2_0]|nr:hypothetical protein [Acaryochloris sp. CRU_2_0]
MPTLEQALQSVQVCHWLSNCYLDIRLFRYDSKRQEIFILVGENIGISIFTNGSWEFGSDPET